MNVIEKLIPPKLYKYQCIDPNNPKCYTLDNLRNSCLWFSKIQDINDPFDCTISIKFSSSEAQLLEFFGIYLEDLLKQQKFDEMRQAEAQYLAQGRPSSQLRKLLRKRLLENDAQRREKYSKWGVACVTEKKDNILMWSHYASGHKGVCLEFDTKYAPFNERKYVHPIDYARWYPKLSVLDIIKSPYDFIKPVTTKFTKWKYEKEWRIIHLKGDVPLPYDPKALTAIYFGCAMSEDQKARIASMPARSNAALFSMRRSDTSFKLKAFPYPD